MSSLVNELGGLNIGSSSHPIQAKREASSAVDSRLPPSMLITIGPQCCGKTITIREEWGGVLDVTIDDQDGVYKKVSTDSFMQPHLLGPKECMLALDDSNLEQRLVLSRLMNNITSEELASMLSTREPLKTKLVGAVETYIASWFEAAANGEDEVVTTKEIALFDSKAIFPGGVGAATAALGKAARNRNVKLVSWGNTNARYNDYVVALENAAKTNRIVHFIKYLPENAPKEITDVLLSTPAPNSETPISILSGDYDTLLVRNIKRFATTGKYIPAEAIEVTLGRINRIMEDTMPHQYLLASKGMNQYIYTWDYNLSCKAGYLLGAERNVRKMATRNGGGRR